MVLCWPVEIKTGSNRVDVFNARYTGMSFIASGRVPKIIAILFI